MGNVDPTVFIEALIAVGFLSALRRGASWAFKRLRGTAQPEVKAKEIDATAKLQGMSVEFAEKAYERYEEASKKADELSGKLEQLETHIDELVTWARSAKVLLDANGLTIAPIPTIRRVQ